MPDRRRERSYLCAAHGPFHAVAYLHPAEAPRCPSGCYGPALITHADGRAIELRPRAPPRPERLPPAPDERMSAEAIRARLRELLARAHHRGQAALARSLGLNGKWPGQTLRALATGRWRLTESVRRQLSRTLQQLEPSELTPPLHARAEPSELASPRTQ